MNERELYEKLKEVKKLMQDYESGKIEKSALDWSEEILQESHEILRKSYVAGAIGSKCTCCNGSGRS